MSLCVSVSKSCSKQPTAAPIQAPAWLLAVTQCHVKRKKKNNNNEKRSSYYCQSIFVEKPSEGLIKWGGGGGQSLSNSIFSAFFLKKKQKNKQHTKSCTLRSTFIAELWHQDKTLSASGLVLVYVLLVLLSRLPQVHFVLPEKPFSSSVLCGSVTCVCVCVGMLRVVLSLCGRCTYVTYCVSSVHNPVCTCVNMLKSLVHGSHLSTCVGDAALIHSFLCVARVFFSFL